jgi:hypothetical protein
LSWRKILLQNSQNLLYFPTAISRSIYDAAFFIHNTDEQQSNRKKSKSARKDAKGTQSFSLCKLCSASRLGVNFFVFFYGTQ